MQKDNISEIYRKSIDEFLDHQSDLHFLVQLSQDEKDSVWDEILTDLDLGDVWNGISSDLDLLTPPNPNYGIILRSASAFIIITMCLTPVKKTDSNTYNIPEKNIAITRQSDSRTDSTMEIQQTETDIGDHGNIESSVFSRSATEISEDIASIQQTKMNITRLEQNTTTDAGKAIITEKIVTADADEYYRSSDSEEFQTAFTSNLKLSSDVPSDQLNLIVCPSTSGLAESTTGRKRISLGLIAQYKNTWLLNNKTFAGFDPESLVTIFFVFTPDVGITVNYPLVKEWSLQADGFFLSNSAQEYREFEFGSYLSKNITLKYSTIGISAKYKFRGKVKDPDRSSVNIFAGSYLSVLNYAYQSIDGDPVDIRNQYRKTDYGVKLGGEIELYLAPHFSLASGLFFSVGIPNIYRGDSRIPGYLRPTRNACVGVQMVFFYSW